MKKEYFDELTKCGFSECGTEGIVMKRTSPEGIITVGIPDDKTFLIRYKYFGKGDDMVVENKNFSTFREVQYFIGSIDFHFDYDA